MRSDPGCDCGLTWPPEGEGAEMEMYCVSLPPKPKGCYVINHTLRVYSSRRPPRWERFWTRRLLGWQWEGDADEAAAKAVSRLPAAANGKPPWLRRAWPWLIDALFLLLLFCAVFGALELVRYLTEAADKTL